MVNISKNSFNSQSGQVFLLVILIMVVGLTVGLALVSRSITNFRSSVDEENSQRAFSAAEAGIEQALKSNTSIGSTSLSNNSAYQTTVTALKSSQFLFNGGTMLAADDGYDLWLSDYSSDPSKIYLNPWTGILNIYWGSPTDSCTSQTNVPAAMEIIILTGTKNNPQTAKYVFDPCDTRRLSNKFGAASVLQNPFALGGKSFPYKVSLAVPDTSIGVPGNSTGLIARLIPLYKPTPLGVVGTDSNGIETSLPSQGFKIDSTGTYADTQRKITVYQAFPVFPTELFPYALFIPR